MGVDISKDTKTDTKQDQLKLVQFGPSNLLKIKGLYDKNPLNTSFDRRKLISLLNCGKRETDIIFEYFDMDENGVIDSYEFICAVAMLIHSSIELRAEFLFKLYDLDNDNYLSHDELSNLIRNFLISQKKNAFYDDVERKTEKFLKDADMDLDNKLSLKEFQFYLGKNREIMSIFNTYTILSNSNLSQTNIQDGNPDAFDQTNPKGQKSNQNLKGSDAIDNEDSPDEGSDLNNESEEDVDNGFNNVGDQDDDQNQNKQKNKFHQDEVDMGDEMDLDLYNELNKDKMAEEKGNEDRIRIKEGAEFNVVSQDGLFKSEQVLDPVEFSACKPWMGVVLNSVPSDYKPFKGEAEEPNSNLELEFIHGYRCHDTRNNVRFTLNKEIVYHSAAVGIVFNKENRTQKFFFDHIDDITALAIHPNKVIIATGEIGPYPLIGLWNGDTMECLLRINGPLQKGINHLAFSKCGKYLAASAADDDHNIAIFDISQFLSNEKTVNNKNTKNKINSNAHNMDFKTQKQNVKNSNNPVFATGKGPRANVMSLCFNNQNDTVAVPCVNEVNFVTFQGGAYKIKKGVGLKGESLTTITCAAYLNTTLICGTFKGSLVLFSGTSATRTIKGHNGTINSIWIRENTNANNQGFLTGGNDSMVFYWDNKFNIVKKFNLIEKNINSLNPRVRSLCEDENGILLVGTRAGEIIEFEGDEPMIHIRGHFDKELWGLAVHPKRDKYYTAGEDNMLALWDIKTRSIEKFTKLNEPCKLISVSPDGKYLALGCDSGNLYIYDCNSFQMKLLKKDRKQPVSEVRFSPNGQYLAVGSVDFLINIYDVTKNFQILKKMRGHVSRVTHLDFSEDSQIVQSNSTSYDLLYHSIGTGKQIPNGASSFKDEKWATWTCPIGWPVQGIWPPCASGDDINAVDRDKSMKTLVTADDFGKIKLFKYPCPLEKAAFKRFIGHSSHVTCVRFTHNDSYVISTGGNDKSIFQWKFIHDEDAEEEMLKYQEIDDCENNPDEEIEDEADNMIKNFKEDEMEFGDEGSASRPYLGEVKASTPKGFVVPKNAAEPPKEGMKLKYVFGYRAFDTRMNVKYSKEGKIVYHTAALGLVLDKNSNEQTFFTNHDEDMVCLAMHPSLNIVATGQMAKTGKAKLIDIYVWEIESKKILANLKGFLLRAIRNLAFSPDGTLLLANGQDDDNSIAVYDWANNKLVASSTVDKSRVTDCAFKTNTEFVTIGLKHIKFWTLNGRSLTTNKGIFGSIAIESLICMTYAFDNNSMFTGDAKGNLILWTGRNATKSIKAHNGSCYVLYHKNNQLYSGGQDGIIKIYNNKLEVKENIDMSKMTAFNPGIRSLDIDSTNNLLLGLKGGDIIEIINKKPTILMQSHSDKELWGLSINPTNPYQVVTGGGDNTLRIWDTKKNKQIKHLILDQDFKAVDWSNDASFLVVGSTSGKIYFIDYETFSVKETYQSIFKTEKQWIQELKISPDSKFVAYGAHGGVSKVEILNVNPQNLEKQNNNKKANKNSSNNNSILTQYAILNPRFTSALTHLDWSVDSNFIVCNSLAFELKFLNLSAKNLIAASAASSLEWNTFTCLFGFPVQGIWPPESTNYVVNYTCMSNNKKVLATGDDFSLVKLFKYPCVVEKAKYKAYSGHSSHVCKIRFSKNDLFLISVGGNDKSVFIWETDFGTPFEDSENEDDNGEDEGENYDENNNNDNNEQDDNYNKNEENNNSMDDYENIDQEGDNDNYEAGNDEDIEEEKPNPRNNKNSKNSNSINVKNKNPPNSISKANVANNKNSARQNQKPAQKRDERNSKSNNAGNQSLNKSPNKMNNTTKNKSQANKSKNLQFEDEGELEEENQNNSYENNNDNADIDQSQEIYFKNNKQTNKNSATNNNNNKINLNKDKNLSNNLSSGNLTKNQQAMIKNNNAKEDKNENKNEKASLASSNENNASNKNFKLDVSKNKSNQLNRNEIPIKANNNNKIFMEAENNFDGDQCINNSNTKANWLNNIEAPEWANNLNYKNLLKKPKNNLILDYIFGYRTRDTRNNLRYLTENTIVYHSGCYGIIHNLETNNQKIFAEHNEDIIALAVNSSKTLIATSENGSSSQIFKRTDSRDRNPIICIWDVDANLVHKFEGNFFKGVNSLSFSPDSSKLLAISLNDEHDIYLFDLKENRLTATSRGGSTKILDCVFKNDKEFATVGIKHFKYWMIKNGSLYTKEGFFGQCDNKLGLVICQNGNFISGSANGELTVWRDEVIIANRKVHSRNVDSLYTKDEYILSGGRDYSILILDKDLNELRRISLESSNIVSLLPIPRSLEFGVNSKNIILLGTLASEIIEIQFNKSLLEGEMSFNHLYYYHYSLSNTENNRISAMTYWHNKNFFISVSEDCTLRLWDEENNKQIDYIKLDVDNKGNRYKSDKGNINKPTSITLHKDEKDVAIGFIDGAVRIYSTADFKITKIIKFREKQITDVKYSPCGSNLAIASQEGFLDVYDSASFVKKYSLKGPNDAYIMFFDWSTDSKFIISNFSCSDILYFNIENGGKINDLKLIKKLEWATNSKIYGWDVQGIWSKDQNTPKSVDVFNEEINKERIITVGYEDGNIKIFKYPCMEGADFTQYKCHTQKIDCIKFSEKKAILLTSSSDGCICKWKFA